MPTFQSPPPACDGCTIEFPAPFVILLTISREKRMNSIPYQLHWQIDALLKWCDIEPSVRVIVVTGAGKKSFCVGSDLLEMEQVKFSDGGTKLQNEPWRYRHPDSGFAGISRRKGKKPIIAAVNGLALGGGFEIVLNCDLAIASPTAAFGLPEALRGLYAYGGGLPRLIRNVGLQVAGDIALTGRSISAREALGYQLINRIAESPDTVVKEAVEAAKTIAAISPDAIIVTREALREAWETASVERAFQVTHDRFQDALLKGENAQEGLEAFKEKRPPVWKASKL